MIYILILVVLNPYKTTIITEFKDMDMCKTMQNEMIKNYGISNVFYSDCIPYQPTIREVEE